MDKSFNQSREGMKNRTNFLIRQFSVFYAGFALVPFLILFYLYTKYDGTERILFSKQELRIITILIGLGSLAAFFCMRRLLSKIMRLSDTIKATLMGKMDREKMFALSSCDGEIGDLAHSFSLVLGRLENNLQQLETTKKTLRDVISKVTSALGSDIDHKDLIFLLLEIAADTTGAGSGAIVLFDDHTSFRIHTLKGFSNIPPERVLRHAIPFLQWTQMERKAIAMPHFNSGQDSFFHMPFICFPLIYKNRFLGGMILSGCTSDESLSEDKMLILTNISHQIAFTFENSQLKGSMERTYIETVAALACAVEARDPYCHGHSERVGFYAVKIGKAMGLRTDLLQTLRDASRLHDIGKIGISDSILIKPGPLSNKERDVIKRHPSIGESIVLPLKNFSHLLHPIRHHHEWLDGSGYPDGLKDRQIPLITRIMTVADIFDALVSDRPYRKSLGIPGARKELSDLVENGKVDPTVVLTLFKLIEHGDIAFNALKN